MDKKHCSGCGDNFYNNNNPLDIKECWLFKGAKLVKRIGIGHWEAPPYKDKKIVKMPSCYNERGSSRTHYIAPDKITKDGFLR